MQIAQEGAAPNPAQSVSLPETSIAAPNAYADYKIIRRNGSVVGFEPSKIAVAVTKAFLAVNGSQGAASARVRELVAGLTETVVGALIRRQPAGGTFHIEDIQDQVELALMRSGEHDVARSYVLYREERARARAQEKVAQQKPAENALSVIEDGQRKPLDLDGLRRLVESACVGLEGVASPDAIIEATPSRPMQAASTSRLSAARSSGLRTPSSTTLMTSSTGLCCATLSWARALARSSR